MCIVLFVVTLNVSVAVTSSSCVWILPLNTVLNDDDVAVSVSVITPPVETFTLSSLGKSVFDTVLFPLYAIEDDNEPLTTPSVFILVLIVVSIEAVKEFKDVVESEDDINPKSVICFELLTVPAGVALLSDTNPNAVIWAELLTVPAGEAFEDVNVSIWSNLKSADSVNAFNLITDASAEPSNTAVKVIPPLPEVTVTFVPPIKAGLSVNSS